MKSILVIDDDKVILRTIMTILKDKYKVIAAPDGEKALTFLESNTCDLILLDYEMPGIDGITVFKRILEDPNTKGIPVMFLTGNSDTDTVIRVLALGPAGYVVKPVDPNDLIKRVGEALDK